MRKLADIVTSLWLEIIKLEKRVIQRDICILDLLNNIIIGINELYVCKYLLDLDLTLMNIWRDNYCLENDYDSKTKLSIILSTLHWCPIGSYSSDDPQEKNLKLSL